MRRRREPFSILQMGILFSFFLLLLQTPRHPWVEWHKWSLNGMKQFLSFPQNYLRRKLDESPWFALSSGTCCLDPVLGTALNLHFLPCSYVWNECQCMIESPAWAGAGIHIHFQICQLKPLKIRIGEYSLEYNASGLHAKRFSVSLPLTKKYLGEHGFFHAS